MTEEYEDGWGPPVLAEAGLPEDLGVPGYGTAAFYGPDLADPKERARFVAEVVSQVRRCREMKRYREYLGSVVGMDRCSVLSNLPPDDAAAARLELHHHPLTLFDVCEMALGAAEAAGGRLTTMSVAHEVMRLHWRNMVGLVPLLESAHELAHEGVLSIDPRTVFGDWPAMVEELREGLTPGLAAKLAAEFQTWDGRQQERNARLLEVLPTAWALEPVTAERLLGPAAAAGGG